MGGKKCPLCGRFMSASKEQMQEKIDKLEKKCCALINRGFWARVFNLKVKE